MTNTAEMRQGALDRARAGLSLANYSTIFAGFLEKGIPEDQILLRVNVFTFQAWRALGRSVRKGEHGVRVLTWVPVAGKEASEQGEEEGKPGYRMPRSTTVFHVSQTEEV